MKSILIAIILFGTIINTHAQTSTVPADITKLLKFTNDNYDMGKIIYGKQTEFTVDIENISVIPISILNVTVGCGCTTPKYNQGQIIAPGAHATIVLGYNGSNLGNFSKVATILFSGNMTKQLSFHGVGVQP